MSTRAWTTPSDLRDKVRRRWDDGSLLRAFAAGDPFPIVDVRVHGPRATDIGESLTGVREWIARLDDGGREGRNYHVVRGPIGGRHIGRNDVPVRARIESYDQAWRLLGVEDQVADFRRLLDASQDLPVVREWAAGHPHRVLPVAAEWNSLLAAYRWLDQARGSDRYLREISAPGVDTKFVERHRDLLARLLGVDRSATGFVAELGMRAKPETVRLRFDPAVLGLPESLSEGAFRVDELTTLRATVRTGVIVENETTFLTVPVPDGGVVLWGKGFEVSRIGSLPWLREAVVHYWGDLDTHGFAILDRLRAGLPHTRSFLMDRDTLLAHRDRWVHEGSPTAARLGHLDCDESALYNDLVTDRLGTAIRLEQERVDWSWVAPRLPRT